MFRVGEGTVEVTVRRAARVGLADGTFRETPDLVIKTEGSYPGPWDPPHMRGTFSMDREAERIVQGLWTVLPEAMLRAIAKKLTERLETIR